MRRRPSPPVTLLGALLAACAAPYSAWELERAERHLAQGRAEDALRHSERAILLARDQPDGRRIGLHVEVLRALGRHAEAEAFAEFAGRYRAGAPELADEGGPIPGECSGEQDGGELVTGWGRRPHPAPAVGTLAARFQIGAGGEIERIRVLRARDPAAAWRLIESVAGARISPGRLARRRERAPASFPVELCAWWSPQPGELPPGGIPAGGCIRGFCTHAPGTAPHM